MRAHRDYPWISLSPVIGGAVVRCDVCRVQGTLGSPDAARFVAEHATHRSTSRTHLGAGDAVAAVAKPLARALGRAQCTPCEQRRQALNSWMPRVPFLRR